MPCRMVRRWDQASILVFKGGRGGDRVGGGVCDGGLGGRSTWRGVVWCCVVLCGVGWCLCGVRWGWCGCVLGGVVRRALPYSLSRCEDVWRARRDFCGRLFDEQNLFFFSDPTRVILAPPSLQGLQGCREKQKVLLIKQALQALRARILAPPPQVRCAGDDDVSCLHRGGLWPARCQGMRSTSLGRCGG